MRPFYFALLVICLIACNTPDQTKSTTAKNQAPPQSLETFADSLVRLDQFAMESLPKAAVYYQNLVPADTLLADSAAVMFLRQVSGVVDSTNEKLFRDTTDYFDLVYNESPTAPEKQKQFREQLRQRHLVMQGDGEGGVYVVPDYAWINGILQPKTSTATDRYLSLLASDEKEPAMLDAGLAIDINELVNRLITSEQLLQQKLPVSFAEHAKTLNRFYLAMLLFGSDNSPALEFEKLQVTEQYQPGYNYLLSKFPASDAAKVVAEWQQVVKANNQKKVEEWRKKYALY